MGLAYTYLGLVLFLAGANIGFMPAGNYLGQVLAGQSFRWLLVPLGMLIGYFIVKAEPAAVSYTHLDVYKRQVYQHPGGGLLLFVVLKEVLGVLAGACLLYTSRCV